VKRPPNIKEQVPLKPLTSYRIGGSAKYYVQPRRLEELQAALAWANEEKLPFFILGAGSNVLVADRGYNGLIIHLQGFLSDLQEPDREGVWEIGSGASLLHWVRRSVGRGYSGAEALIGIPGTIGGALRMNAGAYGVEIGALLDSAEVIFLGSAVCQVGYKLERIRPDRIGFAYRQAPGLEDTAIVSARFRLIPGDKGKLMKDLRDVIALRRSRQPLEWPSCGSVFKRPAGDFAGRLIEASGLIGTVCGGAQISPKHANFISNSGNAKASDVLDLIKLVKKQVLQDHGVTLQREVILIGFREDELEGA
jgi:UDP-N-acetylmuramate dehydrogenase